MIADADGVDMIITVSNHFVRYAVVPAADQNCDPLNCMHMPLFTCAKYMENVPEHGRSASVHGTRAAVVSAQR